MKISNSKNYMVSAAHPCAIEHGENVLKNGGNALEAAVVAASVLAVVEPYASGIGGGGFMVVHFAASGEELVIDSRVTAPASAKDDMFKPIPPDDEDAIDSSGLSVGVPGALKHWEKALYLSQKKLKGKLKLTDVLAPAIKIAEDGFEVGPTYIKVMKQEKKRLNRFKFQQAKDIFVKGIHDDHSILYQLKLAETLQTISEKGVDEFYQGSIAKKIIEVVNAPGEVALPGKIELTDLANYQVKMRHPIIGNYRGNRIVSAGPPASGATLIELLNIVEGFPFGHEVDFGHHCVNTIYVMIEAMKLAYSDRVKFLADPDAVSVPTRCLTSKDYAEMRRKLISLNSAPLPQQKSGQCDWLYGGSTTHIAVKDADGNMVSYTTSLSRMFGSGIIPQGSGFLLNDTLRDFSTKGKGPNKPQPGKRPKSAMSPTLVFSPDGSSRLIIGAAGGNRIPAIVFQVLSGVLDFGRPINQAIADARFVNENKKKSGDHDTHHDTRYEKVKNGENDEPKIELDDILVKGLESRGQKMFSNKQPFGSVQGIEINPTTGTLKRGTDPRRTADI